MAQQGTEEPVNVVFVRDVLLQAQLKLIASTLFHAMHAAHLLHVLGSFCNVFSPQCDQRGYIADYVKESSLAESSICISKAMLAQESRQQVEQHQASR
jgi:hypothetical protein